MPSGRGSAKPNEPEGKRSATEAWRCRFNTCAGRCLGASESKAIDVSFTALSITERGRPAKVRGQRGPDAGAASVQDGAYRRRLRYPRSLARGKAFALPDASARGLWIWPPWHLRAQEPGGYVDCALVLPAG